MNDFAAPKKDLVDEALDELVCPLCMDTFVQPLSLNCLHSYCQSCLVSLVKANGVREGVDCPECRAFTKFSASGGVQGMIVLNYRYICISWPFITFLIIHPIS